VHFSWREITESCEGKAAMRVGSYSWNKNGYL